MTGFDWISFGAFCLGIAVGAMGMAVRAGGVRRELEERIARLADTNARLVTDLHTPRTVRRRPRMAVA